MSAAKAKGSAFEKLAADYLNEHVDDRIERRVTTGANDRGDIGGVRHMGQRVVIECKNHKQMKLAGWIGEAEVERGNDDALAGIVIHKRHGKGKAAEQYVTMTLADLVALLTGSRDHLEADK